MLFGHFTIDKRLNTFYSLVATYSQSFSIKQSLFPRFYFAFSSLFFYFLIRYTVLWSIFDKIYYKKVSFFLRVNGEAVVVAPKGLPLLVEVLEHNSLLLKLLSIMLFTYTMLMPSSAISLRSRVKKLYVMHVDLVPLSFDSSVIMSSSLNKLPAVMLELACFCSNCCRV